MSDGHPSGAPSAPDSEPPPRVEPEDRQVLEALSRGESRLALALCVERHALWIGRLCMAMLGSQDDADDALQETLLDAYHGFGELRAGDSVRAWLLGIARSACLARLGQGLRRGAGPELAPAAPTRSGLSREQKAERGRALLEHVRPSDREALLLRYGADLSFAQVALASAIDEATAKKRVSRALSRLRNVLGSADDD